MFSKFSKATDCVRIALGTELSLVFFLYGPVPNTVPLERVNAQQSLNEKINHAFL